MGTISRASTPSWVVAVEALAVAGVMIQDKPGWSTSAATSGDGLDGVRVMVSSEAEASPVVVSREPLLQRDRG